MFTLGPETYPKNMKFILNFCARDNLSEFFLTFYLAESIAKEKVIIMKKAMSIIRWKVA